MLYEAVYTPPGLPRPDRSILTLPAIAHYLKGWGRQGDHGLIAFAPGGQPAGAAWYRLFPAIDRGYGFVAADVPELTAAVAPEFRGQGIGTMLLEHLQAEAKRAGFRGLSLSVDPFNAAARLYERLGFQAVGTEGSSLTMLKQF